MIDLSADQLEIVTQLLEKHVPECEVRAFGSRINGTAKPYSDLDLVIIGAEKLSDELMSEMKEAFVASDLTCRVDLLDWARISDEFKAVINKEYVTLKKLRPGLSTPGADQFS